MHRMPPNPKPAGRRTPAGGAVSGPAAAPGQEPRRPGAAGARGASSQGNVRSMIAKLSEGRSSYSRSPSKRQRGRSDEYDSDPDLPMTPREQELMGQLTPAMLQTELKKMSEVLLQKMDQSTERLSREFTAMKQRIQDLEKHVEDQGAVIDELRGVVEERDQRVRDLECVMQDIQMEQNRPCLVFDGEGVPPPPSQQTWTEDVSRTVIGMVGKYLPDVSVTKEDIDQCYRVAKGRKIVCKFTRCGRDSPRDVIYEKRASMGRDENGQRREKSDSLFVNEVLTEGAQSAYAKLRKAKRDKLIHTVFTRGGRIYVRIFLGRKNCQGSEQ